MKKISEYTLSKELSEKILIGIKNCSYYDYGVSCLFIALNSKVGVKLFPAKFNRDFSLKWQKKLFKKGIAPETGKAFVFRLDWPFCSEQDGRVSFLGFQTMKLYGFFTQNANIHFKNKDKLCDILYESAEAKGFIWEDCHTGNIGMIGKKLVIIDTDPISLGNYN